MLFKSILFIVCACIFAVLTRLKNLYFITLSPERTFTKFYCDQLFHILKENFAGKFFGQIINTNASIRLVDLWPITILSLELIKVTVV